MFGEPGLVCAGACMGCGCAEAGAGGLVIHATASRARGSRVAGNLSGGRAWRTGSLSDRRPAAAVVAGAIGER